MFNFGKSPVDHYASFSQRMWAATVDSFLLLLLVLPVAEMAFLYLYPIPDMYTPEFQQDLSRQTSNLGAFLVFLDHAERAGVVTRWAVDTLLQTAIIFAFSAFFWKCWSATPGKKLFRMKIVDATTEQPITNRQILLRLFGYVIASVPLFAGVFWIAFDRRRQGWHDKIAHTVVIIVPKSTSSAARP